MPRENRKRGKKHKKPVQNEPKPEADPEVYQEDAGYEDEQETGGFEGGNRPSWVVPDRGPQVNLEAPFGYVDADVKAYFRTVDLQIRDWQESPAHQSAGDNGDDENREDPNEDRRLFLTAALQEMSGKELQLATDPDCSTILERMAYSMDDFTRRVFMDRLAGSYERLSSHRFSSHVCQTVFAVAGETIAREARGNLPTVDPTLGELRTVTQLVSDAARELLPSLSSLIMDQFASHVIRTLLALLSPHLFPLDSSAIRSKKSTVWKSNQGKMKSVFASRDSQDGASPLKRHDVPEFSNLIREFVQQLRSDLNANEVRALAASKVASPGLQMLIEIEADQGLSDEPESLMDHALIGLISLHREDPNCKPEASDFLGTLLRDATSSHLLETLIAKSSPPIFTLLWSTYFQRQLSRLSIHPVANFVVARALSRINEVQLRGVCEELGKSWQKIKKSSRVGVIKALVDRAVILKSHEGDLVEAVCSAFELKTPEDRLLFVPCVLYLTALSEYQVQSESKQSIPEDGIGSSGKRKKSKRLPDGQSSVFQPQTQGALLLSSMMHISSQHNSVLLDSILSLSTPDLIAMAHHPTSSRVLDTIFESAEISQRTRNKFILRFMGHFHELVDDRIGSRVGDRVWARSDPYLKEKIAKSLQPYEQGLAGSQYGKYFVRNVNLLLLKKNPDAWKAQQSASREVSIPSTSGQTKSASVSASEKPVEQPSLEAKPKLLSKRKRKDGDDIDKLFDSALGKKQKRGALPPAREEPTTSTSYDAVGIETIIGAIKSAPKGDGDRGRKKKKYR